MSYIFPSLALLTPTLSIRVTKDGLMKILIVVLYIMTGILSLVAGVLLLQTLVARQSVENATLGYQILLGLDRSVINSLVRTVQMLFCLGSGLFLGGAALFFALARLLVRLNQQSLRIQELEAELSKKAGATSELAES